jgi:hypothetical protein
LANEVTLLFAKLNCIYIPFESSIVYNTCVNAKLVSRVFHRTDILSNSVVRTPSDAATGTLRIILRLEIIKVHFNSVVK